MALTDGELADRLEIDDLLTRYAVAIDTKDWGLLATCFTPDARIDYSSVGGAKGSYPEVAKWLEETLALFPMTQHFVNNRHVTLDGDAATGRSYFYNPMGSPDGKGGLKLFFVGGYYNDVFSRTADGWRIVERVEENAWFDRFPTG
ncbi:MAG: nuclear transport factor 2 family protein [Acidimicrobiia bacterium]|nr:nuclear transport factor 2 family protein [Acidimicrobiia bacterium]